MIKSISTVIFQMQKLKCFILFLFPIIVNGQEFVISQGLNFNTFFDYKLNDPLFYSDNSSAIGFTNGISVNELSIYGYTFDISLSYELYSGNSTFGYNSFYNQNITIVHIETNRISLAIYPFHFRLSENALKIKLGTEYGLLTSVKLEGLHAVSDFSGEIFTVLDDETQGFINTNRLSINVGVQHKYMISEKFLLQIYYELNYGVTNEILPANAVLSNFIQRLTFGFGLLNKRLI